jgi:hypothetical protein
MRKPTIFLPALALGVAGAIPAAAPSLAEPITYTMQFVGTGCIGSSAITLNCSASPTFTQADVTLTMVNDIGNIMFDSTLMLWEINGTATVSVNGGAAATFMDQMQFYTDSSSVVGLFDGSINPPFGLDVVDVFNTALSGFAFTGYQLGPIGPTTDAAALGAGQPINFPGYELTSGDFFILNGLGSTSEATFTATVAAVPEPPIGRGLSVALAIGGMLFGSANLLRRRFHNQLT